MFYNCSNYEQSLNDQSIYYVFKSRDTNSIHAILRSPVIFYQAFLRV